jgi:RNA polymerase sigma-70 factor, ECF subfamily
MRPGAPADAAPRSDEELLGVYVDAARPRGDREAAFRELAERYRRRLYAVCFRVLGSAVDAEDAAQETLLKLARSADGFRGDAKLSTWLYRIARNVCTDRVRYEARRPATPVDDVATVGRHRVEDDPSDAHAALGVVGAALAQLDELSRRVLLLVAVDELSYAEAAEATGLAVGTVKSRVSRARVALGELLEHASEDGDGPPHRDADAVVDDLPTDGAPRGPPPA